jgi:hypothetical protein
MACECAEQDQTDRSHKDSATSLTLVSLAAPIVIAVGGGKGMIRRDEVVAAARARAYSKTPWQPLVATTP